MKIALFLFGSRVSPRFDCAPSLMFVTTNKKNEVVERNEKTIKRKNQIEIFNLLKASNVDAVICGGISQDMLELLKGNNTEVIAWVSGDAQQALELFLRGKLLPGAILRPGRQVRQLSFCRKGKKR